MGPTNTWYAVDHFQISPAENVTELLGEMKGRGVVSARLGREGHGPHHRLTLMSELRDKNLKGSVYSPFILCQAHQPGIYYLNPNLHI